MFIKTTAGFASHAQTRLYPSPTGGLAAPPNSQLCFVVYTLHSPFEKLNLLYRQEQISKGTRRLTAKQKSRPNVAKWNTRNLARFTSTIHYQPAWGLWKSLRRKPMGLLQLQIVKNLRIVSNSKLILLTVFL